MTSWKWLQESRWRGPRTASLAPSSAPPTPDSSGLNETWPRHFLCVWWREHGSCDSLHEAHTLAAVGSLMRNFAPYVKEGKMKSPSACPTEPFASVHVIEINNLRWHFRAQWSTPRWTFLFPVTSHKKRKKNTKMELFSCVHHTRSVSQAQGCWTRLESVVFVGNVQQWPPLSSGNSITLTRLEGYALSRALLLEAAITLPCLWMKRSLRTEIKAAAWCHTAAEPISIKLA